MNKLLLAGLLGGGLLLATGSKKKTPPSVKKITDIYISEDGFSICEMKTKVDVNIAVAIVQNRKDYDAFLSKNQDATIYDLARYRLDQFDKYQILPDVIDATATPAVKFLYIISILSAAIHMVLIGKMSQPMFASWVFDEEGFAKVLTNLGIMSYGDWQEKIVAERAAILGDQEVVNFISNQLMLVPGLKEFQSEVFATLMVIMFSSIVETVTELGCTKVNKFIIADYTSYSEKGINPVISQIYAKFFNIFLGVKKGE